MDLTKRIDLYSTRVKENIDALLKLPVIGTNLKQDWFYAVFVQTDIPTATHDQVTARLLSSHGVHSAYAKEHGEYIQPWKTPTCDAPHMGGIGMSETMAPTIIPLLENAGYAINKKYD